MADFFERSQGMFDLYAQGNFEEALRVTDELAREFPDRAMHTSYWSLCLLSVLGRKEKALNVMEEAIARGLWWSEERLRRDPDLEGLQGDPRYERLVSICVERHELAKAKTKPELLVLEPGADKPTPYPFLMIFHGRDSNAARERRHWEAARDLGWLTVLAQSSQISSPDAFTWDDFELALQEIQSHLMSLQEKYALDASRIVAGGISQGGALTILAALQGDIPWSGFISVVPGRMPDPEELSALAESARQRGLHGVIVAGGKDPRFESFGQIRDTLSTHGIPCMLEIRPDVGHAYPPDFREILEKYLQNF